MSDLLSTATAAQILGISIPTVIAYAQNGKILVSFIARKWRFRQEDLDLFIASQQRSR
jgi:excisionase family DNA binding protein